MNLSSLNDYFRLDNRLDKSPLTFEVVRTHVDRIAVEITDKNGNRLTREDCLPAEKAGFDAKVMETWWAVDRFACLLRERRKYRVHIPYEGKIRGIDYPVVKKQGEIIVSN